MEKIKTGIFGYGYANKVFHIPLIEANENFEIISISSSSPHNHNYLQSSHDELLNNKDIELVVIATPNNTHFDLAKKCLLNNKNIIVDKPFTITSIEAVELKEIAEKQNKKIFVFHNRRFDADFLTIQKLIKENVFGEILYFESHFDRYRPIVRNRWRESAEMGAGLWYDLGSHLVDQVLQLFGTPREININSAKTRENSPAIDWFHTFLDFGQTKAVLQASMMVRGEGPRFIIHGTKASYIKYGLDSQETDMLNGLSPNYIGFGIDRKKGKLYIDDNPPIEIENEIGNYNIIYQNIFECLRLEKTPLIEINGVIETIKILEKGL